MRVIGFQNIEKLRKYMRSTFKVHFKNIKAKFDSIKLNESFFMRNNWSYGFLYSHTNLKFLK